MVNCCGKARSGRFCRECGRRLADGAGVYGLLGHCRTQATKLEKRVAQDHESGWTPSPREAAAVRWRAWADALEKVLAAQVTEDVDG